MVLKKLLGQSPKRWEVHKDLEEGKPPSELERFERAFFQISSVIRVRKGLPTILAVVARESLKFLKAYRSTIFLLDEASGTLETQYTYAPDLADKEVNPLEEKEIAGKALKQGSPLLLREPEDFSDFARSAEQDRKITSLLSIPLFSQGKSVGALSLVLINEKRSFSEKELRCLSIFANQASIAVENAHLQEEVGREIHLRKTFEHYLDQIFYRLQGNIEKEYQAIEEHIGNVAAGQIAGKKYPSENPPGEKIPGGNGDSIKTGESSIKAIEKEPTEEGLQVEMQEASCGLADDLTRGDSSGRPAQWS